MLELGEFLLRVFEGMGSLRYIVSPAYRKRTKEHWKTAGRMTIAADIMGGIIGIAVLIIIVVILVRYMFL